METTKELIGDYVNSGQVIGRGTFATVYMGHHKDTGREVAIKAMHPEKMKQKQALQDREIEVLRSLRHPNIVELLGVVVRSQEEMAANKFKNAPYMFMVFEYCAGGDFATYLKNQPQRRLSEAKAKHWMSQLKDGLAFLSQQRILHRDLKPQNLLLSSKDEATATLKLADFGFARFIHSHAMIETVCGTPLYMAPEILRSEKYAVTSDLWSVGCILFQCLVGRAPFVVRTHFELIMKLEKEEIVVPMDVRSQISPECYDLLMRLLDKNRDTRISWDQFFLHPWFGSAKQSQGPPAVTSTSSEMSSSSSSGSSLANQPARRSHSTTHFQMDSANLTPATVLGRHEAAGRMQRVADRALAVLELADMKMDHGKHEDALVLYRKGIEFLMAATAAVREDRETGMAPQVAESLLERLKVKLRIYQDRAIKVSSMKRGPGALRPPSELILEFALQMGRDGGVSEILGDFVKAEKLYSNGAVMLEQLLSVAQHTEDKAVLRDAVQKFAQRIAHVNARMELSEE